MYMNVTAYTKEKDKIKSFYNVNGQIGLSKLKDWIKKNLANAYKIYVYEKGQGNRFLYSELL